MRIPLPAQLDPLTVRRLAVAVEEAREPILLVGACAGMDLAVTDEDATGWQALRRLFAALHHGPPSAAWVTGAMQGGGVGVVAACDHVLATPDATFALPELLFGLVPGAILPALVGRMGASGVRHLAMRATAVPAARAYDLGLVDVVGDDLERALLHLRRLDAGAVVELRRLLRPDYLAKVEAGIAASRARLPHAAPRLARWADGEVPWSR